MIDDGRAILSDLKAVVFVMGNRGGDVGTELERDVAQVGGSGALHERHRRLRVAFDEHILGHVTRRAAQDGHVALHD